MKVKISDVGFTTRLLEISEQGQIDLAQELGVTTRTLRFWKEGKYKPSPENMKKLQNLADSVDDRNYYVVNSRVRVKFDDGTTKIFYQRSEKASLDFIGNEFDEFMEELAEPVERFAESLRNADGIDEVEVLDANIESFKLRKKYEE